ncbi:ABC-type transport system, involved in lipoprotein release, permease component [Streptoalloteichus tenebrarius]|uniref:ABC-type transport system, involved in lipoprotein release, permease component n=1 Tax=Streptoalloteichus tenebrarius (strain ATCC 17920 / DSM 40477 / JCM 4838 / CBS 697.72 / NBRC 16177 / NCIMB 11028 / NRRL B-12390 / A12253. 1 / ISP 5477) TaxID=1933 RepID=A0ABT1HMJ0_STRSD|nr:hypothetical protein [Streptoalloteichus tenebrarius]MCP2256726.1 ABC-type transport system, involved in lipoprotein release, permease component [Streptoalloteichus tenebrarius]BFF00372.1 hypothetical protein GCM10020241_20470 [Streptoalloteichus tenebrarius]
MIKLRNTALAARLAWRSLAANRTRSLLLVLLIALPLTLSSAVSVLVSTSSIAPEERRQLAMGMAATRVAIPGVSETATKESAARGGELIRQHGGPNAQPHPELRATLDVASGDRLITATTYGLEEPASSLHDGRFPLVEGSLPTQSGQIALSVAAVERLRAEVGRPVRLGSSGEVTVVGTIVDPTNTQRLWAVSPLDDVVRAATASTTAQPWMSWLLPPGVGAEGRWPVDQGWRITSRQAAGESDDIVQTEINGMLFGLLALALGFVALLAGAGFAVIAADARRDLGLLGAVGAEPHQGRRVLTWHGVLVGLAAAVVGTILGLGTAAVLTSPVSGWFYQLWGPARPSVVLLSSIAGMGVLSAVLSARVAGRRTAGLSVLAALRPRPPAADPRAGYRALRWALGCAIALAMSIVLLFLARTEVLVVVAGLTAVAAMAAGCMSVTPWLARRASRAGLAVRLAVRSAILTPGRSAALTATLGSVVLVAGIVLTGLGGLTAKMAEDARPVLPRGGAMLNAYSALPEKLVDEVSATLGSRPGFQITYASLPQAGPIDLDSQSFRCLRQHGPRPGRGDRCVQGSDFPAMPHKAGIVSGEGMRTILGRSLSESEQRAWDGGAAIVLSEDLLVDGMVREFARGVTTSRTFPGIVTPGIGFFTGSEMPNAYFSPDGAKAAGLAPSDQVMWYFPPQERDGDPLVPSEEAQDRATALVKSSVADGGYVYVDRGPPAVKAIGTIYLVAALVVLGLILLIAVIATALGNGELRPEWATLAGLGAAPRFRRNLSASLAAVTSTMGSAVGLVAVGLIAPAQVQAMGISLVLEPWLVLSAGCLVAIGVSTAVGWLLAPTATTPPGRAG